MKQDLHELTPENLRILKDQQGKIYIGTKAALGYFDLANKPMLYGYKDLGSIEQVVIKLAQYQHASRVLRTSVQNQFLQALELFKEAEK